MRPTSTIRGSVVALALALSGSKLNAAPSAAVTGPPTVEVTSQDVDASNQKICEKFAAPGIARYRMRIRTPCGYLMPENAEYCAANNTIYFDDVFVAGQ